MPTNLLPATVELDRRAVEASLRALAPWRPADEDPPTPCAGWRLSDLVAHMTVQQRGFARAVAGERTSLADWAPVKQPEPLAGYRAACADVLAAFGRLTDPAAPVLLPEIRDEPLPAATVVGMHVVDTVVHAWDVARSLGVAVELDDDVLAAALAVARAVPDNEYRDKPGAAFAHGLPVPAGASALDETLLLLGRDPAWRS